MQNNLFDYDTPDAKTLARPADPETSHEAARDILTRLADRLAFALEAITANPGKTQKELDGLYPCATDGRRIGKRCSELVRLGRVFVGEARICSITGKRAQTYFRVESAGMPAALQNGPAKASEAL